MASWKFSSILQFITSLYVFDANKLLLFTTPARAICFFYGSVDQFPQEASKKREREYFSTFQFMPCLNVSTSVHIFSDSACSKQLGVSTAYVFHYVTHSLYGLAGC
jgi:hypothetical protein